MLKSYRELVVWHKAMDFTKEIYRVTGTFPKSETFGLMSQMRRAAVSIPSNIAEGFARRHRREFRQFISVAFGSGAELETQIELAYELRMIGKEEMEKLTEMLSLIMRMLNRLITSLKSSQVASG